MKEVTYPQWVLDKQVKALADEIDREVLKKLLVEAKKYKKRKNKKKK